MELIKSSIKDQVYHILKEKIIKQEIPMGEQLNPRDISEENGISVMPVRDALLRLVNQGLVINKPRVGFYVKSFSPREINHIMEVRRMYELFCIREHFAAIDRKQIKKIEQMINSPKSLTRDVFDEIDMDLHYIIIKASGNQFLINSYNRIKNLLILFQHLNLQRIDTANEEHKSIVRSILEYQQEKAEAALAEHIKMVTLSITENEREQE